MDEQEFKERTKKLGLRVIRVVEALPQSMVGDVIGKQLIEAGTSVGATYRAACRAKSAADTAGRLKAVEEAADETLYWLEMLVEAELIPEKRLRDLMTETEEIITQAAASVNAQRSKTKS